MADRRRQAIVAWMSPLLIGLFGLFRVMQSPRFEAYHTVDVVQLIASGACFGVSIAGVVILLRRRGSEVRNGRTGEGRS